jgi:amino acid adenylation domain-containing protein
VPFWCCVAVVTLIFAAGAALLNWNKARKDKNKKKAKVRQRGKVVSQGWFAWMKGGKSVAPESCNLEVGLLNEEKEVHVGTEKMSRVCAELGITHGLEAASLAVALAVQRRRSYATGTAGVLPKKAQKPKEIDVELADGAMTFKDLLLKADTALQSVASGNDATEALELVFAWDHGSTDDLPAGKWVVCPVSATELLVCTHTLAEEKAFQTLFEGCAANPNQDVWGLPAAPKSDVDAVLAWGKEAMDFAKYRDPTSKRIKPIPHLLEGPPANPQADAVAGDGFTLSYEELYRRANAVNRAVLQTAARGRSKSAIVYMPRGEAIAPAFLGVLQAGFQFVPVDVHWPLDRAVAVTEDCNPAIVLVEPSYAAAWHSLKLALPVVTVDASLFQREQLEKSHIRRATLDQDDPAIMLFTSGSTGKPKGIMLSHGYLTGLAATVADWKRMSPKSKTLCYHSPTWMPFIDYLFAPLLKGGTCLFFPESDTHVVKPIDLSEFADRHGATNAGFVPAMLDIFLEQGLPKSFTDIGCGGAPVPAELCTRVLAVLGEGGNMYEGYSGTEIGDVTSARLETHADVERWANDKGYMGASRPHAGQRLAILDENGQIVGPGGVGEITVAGPVLATGYLNLPEKTAETFLAKCPALGARAARSGDLAMWTETGNLQVVGRRDAMVKVRGARIELGEVETAVLSHPAVKTAVVTVYEDQLVAYVVPAVPANLRDHCKERLVAYMVPHRFEGIEEMPRLPNGKVNKKALPKPAERTEGAETVMELDSLGQMRKFTRRAVSEDRVLDNVRAILIGVVIQSHAIPLLPVGAAMLDVASRPLNANWGPWQLFILQIIRGGGWSSLAFLNGFDDTRGMKPYGFTYREPLFLILWFVLDFNWTMWYLPAFVLMRAAFCAAHHLKIEYLHLLILAQIWILMPAYVDLYIGWKPQSSLIPEECPSQCWCPWKEYPQAQTIAYYTMGWWVAGSSPLAHSMVGHALIFVPCYWIGFYFGSPIFKMLTKVADEPNILKRVAIALGVLGLYCAMYMKGQDLINDYDDRCSAFWSPQGTLMFSQIAKNFVYFIMNLSMSLTYVVFIAAAVPVHLKYMAKICFSSLIFSAFTPCILDFPSMALELRKILPASISSPIEMGWIFTVPFLYELVVGAICAVILPIVAKALIRASAAVKTQMQMQKKAIQ